MEEKRNYYIYRHLKPCGEVFYVGLSKNKKRAKDRTARNRYWKSLVKKHPNYEVQILTTGLTKDEACEIETTLISWYGRRDLKSGTLVNLTSGGDGVVEMSEEGREKISRANKERLKNKENHYMYGRKGELCPLYGKPRSEEFKQRMSIIMKERYANMEINPMKGVPQPNRKLLKGADNYGSKPIIDVITLETFVSIREASKKIGINRSRLAEFLNGKTKNRTNLVYLKDYVEGMQVKEADRRPHKKEVLDTATGIIYSSCAEASRQLGISKNTLSQYLTGKKLNKTTLIFKPNE